MNLLNIKKVLVFFSLLFLIGSGFYVLYKVKAGKTRVLAFQDYDFLPEPEGWVKKHESGFDSLVAPEGDLIIYFHEEPVDSDFDVSERALVLWRQIDPDFSYKETLKQFPSIEGWDKVTQIGYDIPSEEQKIAIFFSREKSGIAYINLILGGLGTMSKRGTQLNSTILSWQPLTIEAKDYSQAPVRPFQDIQEDFDKFVDQTYKELKIPGMAVGIIQNGEVVYKKGFGQTKLQGRKAVDSDTLFMIGSTTKALTTLMMAKLAYEGKLKWDDPIHKFLKTWRLKDKDISDQMLMKHSVCACTGMPRRDLDFVFEFDGISPEERMKQMQKMLPTTMMGETFQYSNLLVAAGGFAAGKAYAPNLSLLDSWTKAMEELVFQPLNMKRTVVVNEFPYRSNSAFPHAYNLFSESEALPPKVEEFVISIAPAGSIWSNIDDMLNYLLLELNSAKAFPDYIDLANLVFRREKGVQILRNKSYYGLGLLVTDDKGLQVIHHGGQTAGFSSEMFFIPEKNIAGVILMNLGRTQSFIQTKLLELLFEMDQTAEQQRADFKSMFETSITQIKSRIKSSIAGVSRVPGMYHSKHLGNMSVYIKNDRLWANFGEFEIRLQEKKTSEGTKRVFISVSPPFVGVELIKNGEDFILYHGQTQYVFERRNQ